METNDTISNELDKKILTALCSMELHVIFNNYALENVVLGNIKPGDQIPYDFYIESLNLRRHELFMLRHAMNGKIINKQECVIEQDMERYYRLFFIDQINEIFETAPKYKDEPNNDLPRYKYGLQEYLQRLYDLYKDIIETEIHPEFYELIYPLQNRHELIKNFAFAKRFVAAIKLKKLKQGSRIDRYATYIIYRSEFLNRLVKSNKSHYLLANSDTNSLDYKLALLSCFTFYSSENASLFELKIKEWERTHRLKN